MTDPYTEQARAMAALSAENGLLRAENDRLRDENARLKEIEVKYDQFISGAFI